jgi:hypothetical protein
MKIEKCPFCGKEVAEISNCQELEGCRHFEGCPATEPYVCVVCNMFEGGCGASSGYYDSAEKAIAAWNRRVGSDINVPTNADRIRSMTDEELAKIIVTDCLDERIHYCQNRPECIDLLDTDEGIPEEMCIQCVLDWLRQPAEDKP